jgi:hypothetical protein
VNFAALIRLVIGKEGFKSNLESWIGIIAACGGIWVAQKFFGITLDDLHRLGAVAVSTTVSNQLLANIPFVKRVDSMFLQATPGVPVAEVTREKPTC